MTDTSFPKITTAHVLATAAVLFVPMAILAVKGLAPLFALAAVAVAALELARRRRLPLSPGPVLAVLAAFVAWALVTWLWSIAPDETAKTGISLAVTLFGGAVLVGAASRLDAREREVFDRGLIVGGGIGLALVAFEFATDAWLQQFLYGFAGKKLFNVKGSHTAAMNPGLAATALFVWAWALAVRARYPRRAAAIAVAIAFALVLLCDADAVVVGLIAGAVAFGTALALPRAMPWIMAAVFAVGVVAAPLIPGLLPDPFDRNASIAWLSPSAAHRIVIWNNAVTHIKNHPLVGSGFDTTRALYSKADRVSVRFPEKLIGRPSRGTMYEPIPLHPHNGVLQVWLEMGAVGALILLALLLALLRAVVAGIAPGTDRAAALAMLTTTVTIGSISFGAWQSWWLAAILLAGAFLTARVIRPPEPAPAARQDSPPVAETGGPKGLEPTRYGDWERKGRAIDF